MGVWSWTQSLFGGGRYHEAAGRGRRFSGLHAPQSGPNAPVIASAEMLAARSYALERNDPIVWRGINALCASIVGTGIMPQPLLEDETVQAAVLEAFEDSVDESDADGRTDWYGQQAVALRAVLMGGDCFGRKRTRLPQDNLLVPLQLQLLEAAMCPISKNENALNGNVIRAGIEFGPIGNRVAYHLYREHPSDWPLLGRSIADTVPVPASEVLHVAETSRPGQLRGEPRLARVILPMHDLHQGEDALGKSWAINAALTAFIESPAVNDVPPSPMQTGDPVSSTGQGETTIEVGTMLVGLPGEKLEQLKPPEVGMTYEAATKVRLRRAAAGFGTTYEQLSQDLEGVTYSSIRSGLLQFWAECDQFLWSIFIPQFCRPWYIAWFEAAVNAGVIPIRQADFNRDRRKYLRHSWIQPKRPWVDPLKDVQAEIMAVNAGFKSGDDVVRETQGRTPESVDFQRAKRLERQKRLGLVVEAAPEPVAVEDDPPARRKPERSAA